MNICRSLTFLPLKALLEIGSLITTLIPDLEMLLVSLFLVWALVLSCLCKYFCNRTTSQKGRSEINHGLHSIKNTEKLSTPF